MDVFGDGVRKVDIGNIGTQRKNKNKAVFLAIVEGIGGPSVIYD